MNQYSPYLIDKPKKKKSVTSRRRSISEQQFDDIWGSGKHSAQKPKSNSPNSGKSKKAYLRSADGNFRSSGTVWYQGISSVLDLIFSIDEREIDEHTCFGCHWYGCKGHIPLGESHLSGTRRVFHMISIGS